MKDGKCKRCNHRFQDHHHFDVKWVQISDNSDLAINERWQTARDDEKNEVLRTISRQALDGCNQRIDDATQHLAQLAEEYSRLSLSGSFSAQVEKAVKLLKLRYEAMEQNGVSGDHLRKVKESLDLMEKKLELLIRANEIPRSNPHISHQ